MTAASVKAASVKVASSAKASLAVVSRAASSATVSAARAWMTSSFPRDVPRRARRSDRSVRAMRVMAGTIDPAEMVHSRPERIERDLTHPDAFDVAELANAVRSQFTTVARTLDAAEW